jgi:RNA 2',3'-cyclic 3'-phosphodiesterase
MTASESWRIFCAVELPADTRARLQEHVRQLRAEVPDAAASWTRVENIHLTLKFFGNVPIKRLSDISAAASRAAEQFSTFEIEIGGTGVFPKPSRPQVLWIGVKDPSGKLLALQECFGSEDRAYKPHLTIARIRRPDGSRQLADTHLKTIFKPQLINVHELIVFRSELSSQGSRYTALTHHQLNP